MATVSSSTTTTSAPDANNGKATGIPPSSLNVLKEAVFQVLESHHRKDCPFTNDESTCDDSMNDESQTNEKQQWEKDSLGAKHKENSIIPGVVRIGPLPLDEGGTTNIRTDTPTNVSETSSEDIVEATISGNENWMFQNQDNPEVSDPALASSLTAFAQALRMHPTAEKQAYLDALERCPDLLATESNPASFLVFEKYNVGAAVQRFVLFWKVRRHLFGEDRAFLAMNATGSGALVGSDLAMLETGMFRILPRDELGREVVFHNPTLVELDTIERVRCAFYIDCMIMRDGKSSTEGISVVVALDKVGMERSYGRPAIANVLRNAMPFRINKAHIVKLFDDVEDEQFFTKRFVPRIVEVFGCPLEIHGPPEDLSEETPYTLSIYYDMATLPLLVGGTLQSTETDCMQLFYEEQARFSTRARRRALSKDSRVKVIENEDRKRKVNAVASRRKRMRRKEREDMLLSTRDDLIEENALLEKEYAHLQRVLQEAHHIVAMIQNCQALFQQKFQRRQEEFNGLSYCSTRGPHGGR